MMEFYYVLKPCIFHTKRILNMFNVFQCNDDLTKMAFTFIIVYLDTLKYGAINDNFTPGVPSELTQSISLLHLYNGVKCYNELCICASLLEVFIIIPNRKIPGTIKQIFHEHTDIWTANC